jgi:DNA-binding LytR/AlgR family response regulator
MNPLPPRALIADDEPLLRAELQGLLAQAWPELQVVAQARNGREALALFEAHTPEVCFLDVQMPGLSGVEAARLIGRRAHLVFVTAFDQYALQAFEQGVLDYLVKPVRPLRLADTVARLQQRVRADQPAVNSEALLQRLAEQLQRPTAGAAPLRWIRASVGPTLRLIPVEEIDYLRSDSKCTLVACRAGDGSPAEAVISTPLKDLLTQLDPTRFVQVHRSVVVNLGAVSHVVRGPNDTADIHLKRRPEVLPVSRSGLAQLRQM